MKSFAIGRYGKDDWRLLKWDGSTETEIGSGWTQKPTHEDCIDALLEYHGAGKQPFSSREGTIDSHALIRAWPIPTRNMRLSDETMPWNDA